jgi:hypothetical protein
MANSPYNTLKAEITKPATAAARSGTFEKEVIPVSEKANRLSILYLVVPVSLGGLINVTVDWRKPTH